MVSIPLQYVYRYVQFQIGVDVFIINKLLGLWYVGTCT
jgi:hypothetical protein